jgi:hypothetical protein
MGGCLTLIRASFMGVKLGGAMPGYQFALYKRTVN